MRKVAIYGSLLRQAIIYDGRIPPSTDIISSSPRAIAFNTMQLYSNYLKCMCRRFRGHVLAQLGHVSPAPFPKHLFALQSAYIPVYWISGKDYMN